MLHSDYLNVEKTRRFWSAAAALGLALELTGAILIFAGRHTLGLVIAIAGFAVWMGARYFGMKRYTALCAELRLRYGLGMQDMSAADPKELRAALPLFPLLPTDAEHTRPLMLHPWRGQWKGHPVTVSETTVGYGPDPKKRQFLTGTLLAAEGTCSAPGLLAIYGQPYGGVPLSKWQGMENVDTGERKFLLLRPAGTEVSEYVLDALGAFGGVKEKTAILWTEADRVYVYLPVQFYSGNWTLFKNMPEEAVSADPLPALEELPRLLKKLTA